MAQRELQTQVADAECPTRARVYYVIDSLGAGGAERSLAELLPFFLDAGLQVTLVCLKRRDIGFEADIRPLGCDLRFLPPGPWWKKVGALRTLIIADRPDLVHTTLFGASVIGRLAAAGTRIPVLTSLVNTTYDQAHRSNPGVSALRLRVVQAVDSVTAGFMTTHFHAISEAVKISAVEALGLHADRITVIERGRTRDRLGHATPERRRQARQSLGLAPDAEVLLNVARQEYQKGQRHLLEAVAPLLRQYPKLVLLVVGRPGRASAELQALAEKLQLGDRVRFLGHRSDVPELLAAADIFVFPSLYEGLGGAVLEAMAMSLPVVASDIPALREATGDGGCALLVKPADADALRAAIDRLLRDPALREGLGAQGVTTFEEKFGIERSARRMIELYRTLAGHGLSGPEQPA